MINDSSNILILEQEYIDWDTEYSWRVCAFFNDIESLTNFVCSELEIKE